MKDVAVKIVAIYRDGFRSMSLGRTLWKIVLLKLFVLFFILRPFFFSDTLSRRFATEEERATYVLETLLERTPDSFPDGRLP